MPGPDRRQLEQSEPIRHGEPEKRAPGSAGKRKAAENPTDMLKEVYMLSYIWPIALVVLSNTVYQICAKSVPDEMNPFASLTVTYLVGAAASALLYFLLRPGGNLIRELGKLNWAPLVLGLVIVGLETGWIYAYKTGWQVSTGFIVQSSFLAAALLLVGYLLYHEALTWNKLVGVAICLIGLVFINYR